MNPQSSGGVENNTTRVTAQLREAIVSGELAPSVRLRAEALATRFGTSRSPIREALLVLEREGLVQVLPNRGAIVRPFDADDLKDLYRLRCVLEPHAARLAAAAIDDAHVVRLEELCDVAEDQAAREPTAFDLQLEYNAQFHAVILEAAQSTRLEEAMKGTSGIPRQFRSLFWSTAPQRDKSLVHHREIACALKARDAEYAEAAMRLHMLQALQFLEELIAGNDGKLGADDDD